MLIASFVTMSAPRIAAQAPNLIVSTQTNTGTALAGYWIEVTGASGNVIQTGFSPGQFTLAAGSYNVYVGDYGGEYFNHWTDGNGARVHPVTIGSAGNVTLAAIYCPQTGCGGSGGSASSSIFVSSQYSPSGNITGMFVVLASNGQTVASGFTPAPFSATSGQSYSVTISDYTNAYFSQWRNGVTSRTMIVTATSSQTALIATFCQTQGCSSGGGGGGGGAANTITVTGSDLRSGAALSGMYVDLRLDDNHVESGFTPVTFSGLQTGAKYLVVVYWYGDYYFRHFSNGNLERYSYVTLNATAGQNSYTLNALYESVPAAQAASLNVIAQFPNGTQIGTASEIGGYPQHTPGMYLSVTPPGSTAPFTATFTGGSILPFILFNGQTYAVSMSAGYGNIYFDHWKDSGSTNPDRAIPLNGGSSYIAVYVQR